jgi:hypothetical protein
MQVLLDKAFQSDPIGYATNHAVTFNYSNPHKQQRLQLDGALEVTPPPALLHAMKFTTTVQYRFYRDLPGDPRPAFTPDHSLELQNKLAWTVVNNVTIGPFANWYRVAAKGATGPFTFFDYGIAMEMPIFFAFNHGRLLQ